MSNNRVDYKLVYTGLQNRIEERATQAGTSTHTTSDKTNKKDVLDFIEDVETKTGLRGSLKMDNRCENEEGFKEVLDFIQNHIETEIPYAEVVFQEDTYHEDIDELIRFLLFSRGENEYFLSYGYDGYIYSYSKSIPKILLLDIHNAICFALKSEFIIPLQLKATRNYDEER